MHQLIRASLVRHKKCKPIFEKQFEQIIKNLKKL